MPRYTSWITAAITSPDKNEVVEVEIKGIVTEDETYSSFEAVYFQVVEGKEPEWLNLELIKQQI